MRFTIFYFLFFHIGVKKNNDVARSVILCKSNNFDSPAEVIQAEHRIDTLYKRERRKQQYTKIVTEFWNGGSKSPLEAKYKNA